MFNPDSWQSHSEYQTVVETFGRRLSRNNPKYHFDTYATEATKLLMIDLDPVRLFCKNLYSSTGRPAKNQAQILRSMILFALLLNRTDAKTSLTYWVQKVLPNNVALQVICGFSSHEKLPPLGSYYDLINRLWKGSRVNYSWSALLPGDKNSKKPNKTIGADGKLQESDINSRSARTIVDSILRNEPVSVQPESILQTLFLLIAVIPSVKLGLIDSNNLTISGDGTAVISHSNSYGKRLSSCKDNCHFLKTCDQKHFSDPDAGWGWDSDKKTWFFGSTLYMLCSRNNEYRVELPLLFKYTDACRHDSKNFLFLINDYMNLSLGPVPKNICLDSAHDNYPTYELLDKWNINALIDINERAKSSKSAPSDIIFNKKGHPLCQAGYEMHHWGFDRNKNAVKYRCPLKCNIITSCNCISKCSQSHYGRTIYLKKHGDLRFHTRIPRDSEQYAALYKERTACERVNARVLNDYCLQFLKIRGRHHFSFWTMIIGICIHLDARYKKQYLLK